MNFIKNKTIEQTKLILRIFLLNYSIINPMSNSFAARIK